LAAQLIVTPECDSGLIVVITVGYNEAKIDRRIRYLYTAYRQLCIGTDVEALYLMGAVNMHLDLTPLKNSFA
jgi:hypothetical protein